MDQQTPTQRRRNVPTTTGADVDETSDTYDPDDYKDFEPKVITWAMPRNITEAEATRTCREKLETSALWSRCNKEQKQEADTYIGNCIEDVKIGDTFDGVDSMIESFTTACQEELAKDPDSYVTDPETGKSIMNPEISTDICSTICDVHGSCVKGNCVCDEGYTGDNCQLPINQPPILYKVRGSSLCDIAAGPCRKIFIDAAYIQQKNTLACKVREVLPDEGRSVTRFVVAVTVDGTVYSNELNVTVYDATCQNCTLEGCVKLTAVVQTVNFTAAVTEETVCVTMDSREITAIFMSRRSPLCDIAAGPCQKIVIDAAYIRRKDTLACKVREVLPDGSVSTDVSMEEAVFLTVSKLSCALPDTKGRAVTRFVVAVTVDGKVYSNELDVTVYDATCQNCTLEGCVKLCYRDRDFNPDNVTQVCDVATSTSRWTYSCGANCELHGSCDRGNCVCDDGFTGDNCHLHVPPVLNRVRGSPLCDIAAGPCQKIVIDAAYIRRKDTLACKVREVLPDGSVSTDVSMEEAVFLTVSKLSCALPDTKGRSVTRFVVAVTVDGKVYSNELDVTVYDATCQNCTLEGCVKLTAVVQTVNFTAAVTEETVCVTMGSREITANILSRRSPLCDTAAGPCQKIFIDAAYIQMKDTLACKVREVSPDGSVSTKVSMEEAVFVTVSEVSCALPDPKGRAVTKFVVAVTVDGTVYSNELNVTVYDATCQNCTLEGCVQLCYRDRDFNPDNVTEVCDVATSASRWTYQAPGSDVSVSLTGPNADNAMECSFRPTETNPLFRYKVFWFIGWNDNRYSWTDELLPSGKTKAFYDVAKLPKTGTTAESHVLPDNGRRMTIFHLDVKVIVGKTFRFLCQFEYAIQHPPQAFEVAWTFEGVTKRTDQVADPNRSVSLDGTKLKGNLGKKLGCKVRAFYTNHPQHAKGPWLKSNVYWAGIRPEQNHLTIRGAHELRNVTLTSTIPILCQDTRPREDESCCIPIDLRDNDRRDSVHAASSCSWPLCKSRWNDARKEAKISIPLSARKDQITDMRGTDLLLKFHNLKPSPQHGPYLAVFGDYEISSVQIDVVDDEAKVCSVDTSLNIFGLSRNRFGLRRVGDYTIYQNTQRYFEVQIRSWLCFPAVVTCVCGVAVREYDDLIVIDGCKDSYYAQNMASPEIKTFRKLRPGVSIKQATDGSQISVYLPSGSEILVKGRNKLYVELKVLASDRGQGRGICGTYDDDNTNEFTLRDGHVDTMCSNCEPRSFTESWSNTHATSLFRTVPHLVYKFYFRKYCQCDGNNQRADCTMHVDPVFMCFPNCVKREPLMSTKRRDVATIIGTDVDETPDTYEPDG
ncbi:hypothetical protein BaRGS_00024482 [Batillaria attramentaria]|uniref:von Willebrand factor D and EGF domain-containing protein n=1 Tax=Batillaria attramentaria TaxID=370345 RepID=A0ABD0KAV7_9CAEN